MNSLTHRHLSAEHNPQTASNSASSGSTAVRCTLREKSILHQQRQEVFHEHTGQRSENWWKTNYDVQWQMIAAAERPSSFAIIHGHVMAVLELFVRFALSGFSNWRWSSEFQWFLPAIRTGVSRSCTPLLTRADFRAVCVRSDAQPPCNTPLNSIRNISHQGCGGTKWELKATASFGKDACCVITEVVFQRLLIARSLKSLPGRKRPKGFIHSRTLSMEQLSLSKVLLFVYPGELELRLPTIPSVHPFPVRHFQLLSMP